MTDTAPGMSKCGRVSAAGGRRLANEHRCTDCGYRGDGEVDVQAPAPAEVLGEQLAKKQAHSAAGSRDRAVDGERAAALLGFGEGGRQQGKRGEGEQRAERSLPGAGDDEHAETARRATDRRGDTEADQARDQHALAPEQV